MPDRPGQDNRDPAKRNLLHYLLVVAAVAAVGLAGYVGYLAYPRFELPRETGIGLVGLAAAAGVASFFSPCSFPLLVTLLVKDHNPADSSSVRARRAIRRGVWIAIGAAAFVIGLGLVVAAGGAGLARSVTFDSAVGRALRGVVGVGLIAFGLIQTGIVAVNLRRFQPAIHRLLGRQAALRRRRPAAGHILFGCAYLAAGFGWTGPITAGLAVQALTTGGFSAAFAAYAIAAATLVVLILGAAIGVSIGQDATVEQLRDATPSIKRWGGCVLIIVGTWFVLLATFSSTFEDLLPV